MGASHHPELRSGPPEHRHTTRVGGHAPRRSGHTSYRSVAAAVGQSPHNTARLSLPVAITRVAAHDRLTCRSPSTLRAVPTLASPSR